MKVNLNRKGFTLVELLAVIVVLAVIILIAMPSVLSSMEKARKNAFAVECNEVIRVAQTAYADYVMTTGAAKNDICITYKYLANGFLDKKDGNYAGSVLINIEPSTGVASYKIWLSNVNYITKADLGNNYIKKDITSDLIDKVSSGAAATNTCGGKASASSTDVTWLRVTGE